MDYSQLLEIASARKMGLTIIHMYESTSVCTYVDLYASVYLHWDPSNVGEMFTAIIFW